MARMRAAYRLSLHDFPLKPSPLVSWPSPVLRSRAGLLIARCPADGGDGDAAAAADDGDDDDDE
jgi:hypothetical protein